MSRYQWDKGQRTLKNAADVSDEERLILMVPRELFDRLDGYATSRGEGVEEVVIRFIQDGLEDYEPETTDGAAGEKETRKQTSDGKPASEGGAADPDNGQDGRRKERPAARLTPLTSAERVELTAKIQNLYFTGRDNEARDLQKIMNQRERYEEKPTVEQQRQQLTAATIKAGNSLVRP
jgi:hypothetical protein